MMGQLTRRGMGAAFLALSLARADASPATDERVIRGLQQRQAAAWNAHDIAAYSDLFTADAHVVNVLGWHWTSRAELREKLGVAFHSVFARSRMTIGAVDVELLERDVAVAHVRWTMSGASSPSGPDSNAPQDGIQTQVLVKRGGVWRIVDFQNTNAIPERPFPTAR